MARLDFQTRRAVAAGGHGERRSRSVGAGIEFHDFRPYEEGDDLRYVDRHASARLDRLFVRIFARDDRLPVTVFVDSSASMGFGDPSKLVQGARLAAGFGFIALSGGGELAITELNESGVRTSATLRGVHHYRALCEWLTEMSPGGRTHLPGVLSAHPLPRLRGGLALLVSDLMGDGLQTAVQALRSSGWEVFVLHVLSPEELEPVLSGNIRCVDSETGEEIDVTWDVETAARYEEQLRAWRAELQGMLSACEAGYMMIQSNRTPEEVFLSQFQRAGLLR